MSSALYPTCNGTSAIHHLDNIHFYGAFTIPHRRNHRVCCGTVRRNVFALHRKKNKK